MPVRIYEIAKRLGIENKEVLAKAKELGIAHAIVPSSSLDKITGEFLEDELRKDHPPAPVAPPVPAPEVAPPPPPPPDHVVALVATVLSAAPGSPPAGVALPSGSKPSLPVTKPSPPPVPPSLPVAKAVTFQTPIFYWILATKLGCDPNEVFKDAKTLDPQAKPVLLEEPLVIRICNKRGFQCKSVPGGLEVSGAGASAPTTPLPPPPAAKPAGLPTQNHSQPKPPVAKTAPPAPTPPTPPAPPTVAGKTAGPIIPPPGCSSSPVTASRATSQGKPGTILPTAKPALPPPDHTPSNPVDAPSLERPFDIDSTKPGKSRSFTISEGDTGWSYKRIFGPSLKNAKEVTIQEPYLEKDYQLINLVHFCELLASLGSVEKLHLKTKPISQRAGRNRRECVMDSEKRENQRTKFFERLKAALKSNEIVFDWLVVDKRKGHDRHVQTDTGWEVALDQGLHIYQDQDKLQNAEWGWMPSALWQVLWPCREVKVRIVPLED